VGDSWVQEFRDNPSMQLLWNTRIYDEMWTGTFPLPVPDPEPGEPEIALIENISWEAMRNQCFRKAERLLKDNGFADDPLSLTRAARAVSAALQRASLILEKYERGDFPAGEEPRSLNEYVETRAPGQTEAKSSGAGTASIVSMTEMLEGWWRESKAAGRKPSTYESYRNTFAYFSRFLGHDDASRVSVADVVGFKDHRLSTPSPKTGKIPSAKTVKDSDLSAMKAVFGWAVQNGLLIKNPAANISIKLAKPKRLRSKGFTDEEAEQILASSLRLERGGEHYKTWAAKRWVPWLCAFTGARVGELAQLRGRDVIEQDGIWIIRITPDAGTVKTNEARDVPLHKQLVDLGFISFVQQSDEGHLFLNLKPGQSPLGPLQGLKNRLAEAARAIVSDPNVAPNHGWRHRFKTIGMQAGIPPRILDAIQGQAPRSVADTYGDVTLRTMASEVAKLPTIEMAVKKD
ncbi:MAG: site-specific integrase, partial [Rhizobiaceae bacterium]|nr:site-specific integrase [Rhizobiaceae bacterium]